ncbi:MAG: sigma-54 dependent transcriptional regulator [Planctomycetaceae bacterium]|nr:sigma-54 dependent transcriptional regulator [Planctomycetaceae bacterium]
MKSARILIVDDPSAEESWRSDLLEVDAWETEHVADVAAADQRIEAGWADALVITHRPPRRDGLQHLTAIRQVDAQIPVVMVAEAADVHLATQGLRLGVGDLFIEPVTPGDLRRSLERLLEQRRTRQEAEILRRQQELPRQFDDFIGSSPKMRKVFETIQQVASTDVDVLIIGETGTGKELVARSIHHHSRRSRQPFVAVDCGAIPENLLESEFFGHEKGAFTGADSRRIGLLEYADGGTFFLDEIGELPLLLQAKLLRTLQERKLRRVGGREEIKVDVRIVAATARDLEEMIRQKRFREDLYYRVNVVRIDLPPLRQRGDDLGLIAEHFSQRFSREMGKPVVGITPEAYNVMAHYRWPGNIRELQNVIRRGIALTQRSMISLDDLPDALVASAGEPSQEDAARPASAAGFFAQREAWVQRFERDYLSSLLKKHKGNVKSAAVEADLPRGTLYRLMKTHNLDSDQFR